MVRKNMEGMERDEILAVANRDRIAVYLLQLGPTHARARNAAYAVAYHSYGEDWMASSVTTTAYFNILEDAAVHFECKRKAVKATRIDIRDREVWKILPHS